MASNWSTLQFNFGPLTPVAGIIDEINSGIGYALEIQKVVIDFIQQLTPNTTSVEAAIINTAITAADEILDQYLNTDAKIHMLTVPPARKSPYNLDLDFALPQLETSWSVSDAITAASKKAFFAALDSIANAKGGNEAFAKTVIESMYDDFDPNRPDYDESGAFYAVVIVVGGQSILEYYEYARALMSVFAEANKKNPMLPTTITRAPQDVRAQVIAVPNSTKMGVRLQWTNAPAAQSLVEFDGIRVYINELAIVRSTDPNLANATDWSAIFGAEQPPELTDDEREKTNVRTTADGKTKLIRIFKYDGVRTSYIDTDELTQNVDYYYTVAYRYSLAEPANDRGEVTYETQKYHNISNVVKARSSASAPSTHLSVAPNWDSHTSLLEVIPDLKYFMRLVQVFLQGLKSQASGPASALRSFSTFLQSEITRYNTFALEVRSRLTKLKGLAALPPAGIYVTTISGERGGTRAFTQELINRLTDETDTTAPPFFRKGFTGGTVIFAGAPNPAALAPVETLMSLILGYGSDDTPYEQALATIDNIVSEAETAAFDETSNVYETFADDLTPVSPDSPDANVPFDP